MNIFHTGNKTIMRFQKQQAEQKVYLTFKVTVLHLVLVVLNVAPHELATWRFCAYLIQNK